MAAASGSKQLNADAFLRERLLPHVQWARRGSERQMGKSLHGGQSFLGQWEGVAIRGLY